MNNSKINNAGLSLVELIVTVAIASILVGTVSIGVSLAFSRDASRCANSLNDALYSVRMNSMSKPEKYTLEIKNIGTGSSTKFVAVVLVNGTATETIYLEGDSGANKIDDIVAEFKVDGSVAQTKDLKTDVLKITFDKSKGCVNTGTGTDFGSDGILQFHITSRRGSGLNKDAYVSLITSTGKHTVGTY